MNSLVLIGLTIFLGTLCGRIFRHFKIPQVVGYIIFGLLIGKSFLHIFEGEVITSLTPLVNFTLGLIGCIIGLELKSSVFKKYGKSIYTILFAEGLLAFILVTIFVTLITQKLYLGLILGAIASATDPASTMNVLWDYKSRGPLTRTLTSIIALDDGLALILYSLVSVFAKTMILQSEFSWLEGLGVPIFEILICIALGIAAALIVAKLCQNIKEESLIIAIVLGLLCTIVGLSVYFNLDLILSSMAFGTGLANILPKLSEKIFPRIKEVATSFYILFFVSIGAQLDIHTFGNTMIISVVIIYLIARSAGKILGTMLGGAITQSKKQILKYGGFCLFTQGGVAMGLALSISHNLSQTGEEGKAAGLLIINIVAATTFVVQLIGPPLVKWAITKAHEEGKDITEGDLIRMVKTREIIDPDYPIIEETAPLKKILNVFSSSPYTQYPVINSIGELSGVINIDSIKNALLFNETDNILLAGYMKTPFKHTISEDSTLEEAKNYIDQNHLGFIPVMNKNRKIIGCFDRRMYQKFVSTKLLQLQQEDN